MRLTLLLFCCTFYVSAQKKLSLAEAWYLAEQNSTVLEKAEEELLGYAEVALSKRLKLPAVNARYQSLLNLGRSINPYTNTYDTRTLLGNTYSVSLSYTLFDNGQIKYRIRAAESYRRALGMEKTLAENDLKYGVLMLYTEVLHHREQVKELEAQAVATEESRNYLDKLYKADRGRYGALLTMEAELGRMQAELRGAITEHDAARLRLRRLINSDAEPNSVEVSPVRYPFSVERILAGVYDQLPELKVIHYYRRQKREEERLLYAQRLPVFSAFSNAGTTYSSAALEVVSNELQKRGYFKQLGHNLNLNTGIGVSFSVFNSVNFRERIQRNTIEQKILWHRENDRKQEIRRVIEEAIMRVNGIAEQYAFSKERLIGLEKLVQINKRSFEEGLGEFTTFLQARRDMEQAQAQLNRLKYQYLLFFTQLEFYRKGVWE